MAEQLSHPGAWRGDELLERADWLHRFSAQELAELDAALQSAGSSGKSFEDLSRDGFPLPTLANVLKGVQDSLAHGSGAAETALPALRWGQAPRF